MKDTDHNMTESRMNDRYVEHMVAQGEKHSKEAYMSWMDKINEIEQLYIKRAEEQLLDSHATIAG